MTASISINVTPKSSSSSQTFNNVVSVSSALSVVLPLSSRFMDNLQTEVLEIEFLSFSKGMPTISEEDFARILLRYTNVDDVTGYLENVRHSIPDEKVSF